MASRRTYGSYDDGCAAAHALDLVGERWTLIVVRELLLGPKRFTDLQRDVLGIGPAVLTQRLHDLEDVGVVDRRRLPGPGRVEAYGLTAWGHELEAVNTALSRWAVASPTLPLEAGMSPDTVVLAMRAHARPVPGRGRRVAGEPGAAEERVALHLTDSRRPGAEPVTYLARLTDDATTVVRSPDPGPVDAEAWATTTDWKACIIGGAPLEGLPDVRTTGSPAAVRRLIDATCLQVRRP
ncbi:winged helix-turn-helix transcriptional regulator [Sanguibacter suaedae]|uniref:Helix-turn-helix transcriptional regulator n=1 Tax=Sanguibacter suaedae TaxID=2795737 RepID=A0A934I768_9MICO|nr:helix-turn-helix domain-containing protein [Sanguibacter suaedae]MBI9113465.1 helix-turn-helix transcriptional regulator [Sanguibacter suaedae]